MKKDRGFVVRILLVIVALIALKYYFHFDLIEWIKSEQGQKIIGPVWSIVKSVYYWLDGLVSGWVN